MRRSEISTQARSRSKQSVQRMGTATPGGTIRVTPGVVPAIAARKVDANSETAGRHTGAYGGVAQSQPHPDPECGVLQSRSVRSCSPRKQESDCIIYTTAPPPCFATSCLSGRFVLEGLLRWRARRERSRSAALSMRAIASGPMAHCALRIARTELSRSIARLDESMTPSLPSVLYRLSAPLAPPVLVWWWQQQWGSGIPARVALFCRPSCGSASGGYLSQEISDNAFGDTYHAFTNQRWRSC